MGLFSNLFGGKKKDVVETFGGMRDSDIGNDFRSGVDDADPDKVWKDYHVAREMIMMWPHFNTLEGLEAQYAQAWESKELLPNGRRVYSAMPYWALTEMDGNQYDPEMFVTKTGELAAGGSPFWAALHALALIKMGGKARGTAYANQTSDEQFAAQRALDAKARAALDATASSAADVHLWHFVNYALGTTEQVSREEFDARFERLWSMDRDNLLVIDVRGTDLLPRWHGRPGELDAFARQAAEATKGTFGAGAYGVIYSGFVDVGDLTVADTELDLPLLHQAFADLKERFKGPWMKSEEMAALAFAEDWPTIKSRYENGFRKYVSQTWSTDEGRASLLIERAIRRAVTGKA